jgi:S-adenosylmethionine synthetase
VSFSVETFGTEVVDPVTIAARLRAGFDLSPGGIIRELELLRPIYRATAAYGHFGRKDLQLPWEAV